ncbi:hypothetical protein D918_09430 [Trichuris suis]|nr:hypothetical protein D918_09430 [Trichuris suis]
MPMLTTDTPNALQWFERLEAFFDVQATPKSRKAAVLRFYLADDLRQMLPGLGIEAENDYEKIRQTLLGYLHEDSTGIVARNSFFTRRQQEEERLQTFMAHLRILCARAFPSLEKKEQATLLVDQFTRGVRSDVARAALVRARCSTPETALDLAVREEADVALISRLTDRTRRYWRCADRRICNARCTTDQDLDKIHITRDGTGDHQHNVGVEGQVRKTVNALKRRAQEEPNATPSQVLRTTIGGVHSEEVLLMLPERNALKRNVNRVQNSTRPPNPTSMRGVELPMNYRVIKRGEPFLMHDSGAEDEERVLIFSTQENVRHLSASATLSCDGTFKTSPTQLAQLFTVHGVVLGYPVPLVYALTMRKREQTYRYVYQRIIDYGEERNWNINPSLCMMDFELANMNAIRSLLPNAEIKGCLFHISQSLWRRISSSGLASSYNAVESDTRRCASMLFGLPFVPVEDVVETFEYIEDQAEESLDDLMDYVKRTYVTGRPPMFPPQTWNVYRAVLNDQHRTNNAVECWHNKFQKVMMSRLLHYYSEEQEACRPPMLSILGRTDVTRSRKSP